MLPVSKTEFRHCLARQSHNGTEAAAGFVCSFRSATQLNCSRPSDTAKWGLVDDKVVSEKICHTILPIGHVVVVEDACRLGHCKRGGLRSALRQQLKPKSDSPKLTVWSTKTKLPGTTLPQPPAPASAPALLVHLWGISSSSSKQECLTAVLPSFVRSLEIQQWMFWRWKSALPATRMPPYIMGVGRQGSCHRSMTW